MAVHWCIVLLSVIISVAVTEHPPNNPPFVLDEVNVAAETRILERVAHLLQSLSDKIKMLDDRVDSLILAQNVANKSMEKVSEQLQSFSTSTTQRMINLEQSLKRLPEMVREVSSLLLAQKETSDLFEYTNKSLGKVSEQLQSFSTSTTQRMVNLEQKLERLPEDTGVYFMQPNTTSNITFEVSRDWSNNHGFGNNWIVFHRRFNGSVDFYRNWTEYKQGFGDLRGEHWLGLDKLHAIVKTQRHELLIVLEDFKGVIAYAHYDDFQIGNETEKYIIKSVGKYTGTAGDSFTYHKDEIFSTFDQDNDDTDFNCATTFAGGWWYYKCYVSHLNGEYLKGEINRQAGIIWYRFRGHYCSLKRAKMMVRPVA